MKKHLCYLSLFSLVISVPVLTPSLTARSHYPHNFIEENEGDTLEDLAERLTYSLWLAISHKNKKKLEKMVSDDFVHQIPFLQIDKEQLWKELMKRDLDNISFKIAEVGLKGKKLIISYYLELDGEFLDRKINTKWKYETNQWKLSFLSYDSDLDEEIA